MERGDELICKYGKLLLKMTREEPITSLCYFIMLFLAAFLINFSMSSMEGASYGLNLLDAYEDGLSFSFFMDIEQEDYEQTESQIGQLEEVESIGTISTGIYSMENRSEAIGLFQYNQDLLLHSNFILQGGNWQQSPNEVVLSAAAKGNLHTGDKIGILLEDGSVHTVTVSGFLKSDLMIQGTALAERERESEWFYENSVSDMYQQYLSMNLICGMLSPNSAVTGLEKKPTFYIKLKKGEEAGAVLAKAEAEMGGKGRFYVLSDGMDTYRKNYLSPQNREEFFFLACVLILFVVGFCVNNILRLYNKKKEFAVYYLSGLTWEGSILLSYLKSLLLFAVAIPAGTIALHIAKAKGSFFDLIFSSRREALVFLALFLGYALCSMPIYLLFKKKDPIELLRKEDEI